MVSAPPFEVPEKLKREPAWHRLEDQLAWYDRKSCHSQRWYKGLKLVQFVLGTSIPVLAYQADARFITACAGALIAVLEAVQHLNQYATLWVEYRSTAERLKHERWLFLGKAGEYRNLTEEDALRLLSERVETHVSTEHAAWHQEVTKVVRTAPDHRGVAD